VDAILGAPKQLHTILKAECTGCNLCIPPCPVDCIHIVPVEEDISTWRWPEPKIDLEQPVDSMEETA